MSRSDLKCAECGALPWMWCDFPMIGYDGLTQVTLPLCRFHATPPGIFKLEKAPKLAREIKGWKQGGPEQESNGPILQESH